MGDMMLRTPKRKLIDWCKQCDRAEAEGNRSCCFSCLISMFKGEKVRKPPMFLSYWPDKGFDSVDELLEDLHRAIENE